MASYHLNVKTVKRSAGRSATAAAAYRSAERIACEREGRVHDYTRKAGVEETFILAPEGAPDWARDRGALWNAAEAAERRGNSVTAREWELALPAEISVQERSAIAREFAGALVERYGVAADVAIHAPHRDGDARNHHAHVLTSTRVLGADGFAEKTRVLDAAKTGGPEIAAMRAHWAGLQNDALERARVAERVDHRSLEAQREAALSRGDALAAEVLDRAPEVKLGPAANAMERRAMRTAAAEGRDYEPVTERGAVVHAARQAREAFAEMRHRLEAVRENLEAAREAARETYGHAREAGQGRVSAGLAALRAAAERDRGRETPGDGADRDDMRARMERVLGRGAGARERDGSEQDEGSREGAGRSREDIRERLAGALDRARPVGPGAAEERTAKKAREAERERQREAARERDRGRGWGR